MNGTERRETKDAWVKMKTKMQGKQKGVAEGWVSEDKAGFEHPPVVPAKLSMEQMGPFAPMVFFEPGSEAEREWLEVQRLSSARFEREKSKPYDVKEYQRKENAYQKAHDVWHRKNRKARAKYDASFFQGPITRAWAEARLAELEAEYESAQARDAEVGEKGEKRNVLDTRALRIYPYAIQAARNRVERLPLEGEAEAPKLVRDDLTELGIDVVEMYWCEDDEDVYKEDELDSFYQCGACGNEFPQSEGEGNGNTCPECKKWSSKMEGGACPECAGHLAETTDVYKTKDGKLFHDEEAAVAHARTQQPHPQGPTA